MAASTLQSTQKRKYTQNEPKTSAEAMMAGMTMRPFKKAKTTRRQQYHHNSERTLIGRDLQGPSVRLDVSSATGDAGTFIFIALRAALDELHDRILGRCHDPSNVESIHVDVCSELGAGNQNVPCSFIPNKQDVYTLAGGKLFINRGETLNLTEAIATQGKAHNTLSQSGVLSPDARVRIKTKAVPCSRWVNVQTLTGKAISIKAWGEMSIGELKVAVQDREGIPPDQQTLVWCNDILKNNRTLNDYNIQRESTIHIILRLRGGMFHRSSGRNEVFAPLRKPSDVRQAYITVHHNGKVERVPIQRNDTVRCMIARSYVYLRTVTEKLDCIPASIHALFAREEESWARLHK